MIADKFVSGLRDEIVGSLEHPSIMLPLVERALGKFQDGLVDKLNHRYIWRRKCELMHTETERRIVSLEDGL